MPTMDKAAEDELAAITQFNTDFALEGEKFHIEEARPEDSIPDLPENQAAREFLRRAPKTGLHLPMGKEVKVMQCWRCKAYGHRTGDKECPMTHSGNIKLDIQRQNREDPMSLFVQSRQVRREEKYERVQQLMVLMDEIRKEETERRARKHERKQSKKKNKDHKHDKKRSRDDDDKKHSKKSKI